MTIVTSPSGNKSRWTMIYNGNCPPQGPEPFKFVYCCSGTDNQLAIDNSGRIYTWGTASYTYTGQTPVPIAASPNYLVHPALSDGGAGSGYQMQYPYQVGNRAGWKKAQIYERQFLALDEDNYLWAWGEGYYGMGGWNITSQYFSLAVSVDNVFRPGDSVAIFPTKVNNAKWLDFQSGYNHILALGEDHHAYVWGTNYYGQEFGMPSYGSPSYGTAARFLTPILVNTLPDIPLKIVSASSNNSLVVTESDQIYAWGDFSWLGPNVPELVTFAVPAGVTIKQAIATYQGIVILLSNGQVYVRGYRMQFIDAPDWMSDNLTLIPGGHNFTFIGAFENTVGALDADGNIWGWGVANRFISRDDTYCNQAVYLPSEQPVFIASPTLGARQFTYFSVGNTTHCGIDTQGRLFCWGSDLWGQLGVNTISGGYSCSPLQVAHPTLDDGTVIEVLAYA